MVAKAIKASPVRRFLRIMRPRSRKPAVKPIQIATSRIVAGASTRSLASLQQSRVRRLECCPAAILDQDPSKGP